MSTAALHAALAALGFTPESSSVGAYAFERHESDGTYLLVTDADGSDLPEHGAPIVIGLYDDIGNVQQVTLPFVAGAYAEPMDGEGFSVSFPLAPVIVEVVSTIQGAP
jgi:hypothetical protein